jgi:hypothetical protein
MDSLHCSHPHEYGVASFHFRLDKSGKFGIKLVNAKAIKQSFETLILKTLKDWMWVVGYF